MDNHISPSPKWGSEGRDLKAAAIWYTMVRRCSEDISNGVWLDVGCGSGGIAEALAPRVKQMLGVDPEPWESWSKAATKHTNLFFQIAAFDEEEVHIAPNSIDFAVCNQVYEHVNNPRILLRNIHRVLKPGGICYFAGPNLLWPIEPHVFWPFVHWLPRSIAQNIMRLLGSNRAEDLDAFSATYWRLCSWFKEIGFEFDDAVPTRLAAGFDLANHNVLASFTEKVPSWVYGFFAPIYPGFVFLLSKKESLVITKLDSKRIKGSGALRD